MKKIIIILLVLTLIGGGLFIFLTKKGHNSNSILNVPNSINLKVNCDDVRNVLVSSTVNVVVSNSSQKQFDNLTVRITAYDKNDNIKKQKETVFTRTLGGMSSFNKIVTLPRKVERCDCVILRSDKK